MRTTSIVLIPETTYGTASGNYDGSSLDWDGDQRKALGYYKTLTTHQTVQFTLTGVVAEIIVQATLDAEPENDAQWFDVYTYGDGSTPSTTNFSTAITGNFVWMRVKVLDFSAGTIDQITLTY